MPSQLDSEFRREQQKLNRDAARRLAELFPALNLADIDRTAPGWALAVEQSTAQHYAMSQSLAHRYYEASRGAAGYLDEVSFVLPRMDGGKLRASLTYKGPYAAKKMLSRGAVADQVARLLFGTTSGIALRHGQAGARDTIVTASNADTKCYGWRRLTSSGACDFCLFLADRGAVYREETADFGAHDSCGCTAAPVFKGGELGPEASVGQYIGSSRNKTTADRARLRDAIESFKMSRSG